MATLAADAPTLDSGESIRAAQEKLRRAVQIANLADDPLGVVIDAQIAVLSAQQTMISEVKLSLAQTKASITTDDIAGLNKAAAANVAGEVVYAIRHLTSRMFWRTALAAGAILIVATLIGVGGGYWFRGNVPVLVGVHAGAEKCEDRPDESRLCWIPIFERLPLSQQSK